MTLLPLTRHGPGRRLRAFKLLVHGEPPQPPPSCPSTRATSGSTCSPVPCASSSATTTSCSIPARRSSSRTWTPHWFGAVDGPVGADRDLRPARLALAPARMSTPITVYGDVDERAVSQLRRCADAGDALRGVLCADGHVGYSQPIGGAVAYADHISPSGVGYDIACVAAGTPVTTGDGYWRPIENIEAGEPVLGWDTSRVRVVDPCDGAVPRGERPVRRVVLGLGRELRLTDDHRVRTRLGWTRADELRVGDAVACAPFVGLPYEPAAMSPALLRLLAYCAGDGHLGKDGKTLAWYTNSRDDAVDLAADLASLGYPGGLSQRRDRQHVLTRRSVELHARFASLGPSGSIRRRRSSGCSRLPRWQRAVFLSGFMSARGNTPTPGHRSPRAPRGRVGKRDPFHTAPVRVARFSLTVEADRRQSYVAQLQGGEAEILRYLREVGYNRCVGKRRAAAAMFSVAAQREAALAVRDTAIQEARHLRHVGVGAVREIRATLSARYAVPPALVHHGMYGRGAPRLRGLARGGRSLGRGGVAARAGQRADRRGRARLRRRNGRLGRVLRSGRRRRPQLREQGRADERSRRRDPRRPRRPHGLDLLAHQLRRRAQERRAGGP